MYKGTLSGVLFALIVKTKIPLSQLFYTSAAIDAMDKYQVWLQPTSALFRQCIFCSVAQLDYFESLRDDDFEVSHYLKETKQLTCRKVRQQRVKNRRL